MAAAAGLLLQGLNKAGVQTAMKSFAKSTKSLEEISKSGGFQQIEGLMSGVHNLMGAPLMVPLQVLMAKLAAGSADSLVETMATILELLESPAVATVIDGIMFIFNLIMGIPLGVLDGLTAFFGLFAPGGPVEEFAADYTSGLEMFHPETTTPGYVGTAGHEDLYQGSSDSTVVYYDPNDTAAKVDGVWKF